MLVYIVPVQLKFWKVFTLKKCVYSVQSLLPDLRTYQKMQYVTISRDHHLNRGITLWDLVRTINILIMVRLLRMVISQIKV